MHLRSVKAQLAKRVGCSIAEVDHHDVWQRPAHALVSREATGSSRSFWRCGAGSAGRLAISSSSSARW